MQHLCKLGRWLPVIRQGNCELSLRPLALFVKGGGLCNLILCSQGGCHGFPGQEGCWNVPTLSALIRVLPYCPTPPPHTLIMLWPSGLPSAEPLDLLGYVHGTLPLVFSGLGLSFRILIP